VLQDFWNIHGTMQDYEIAHLEILEAQAMWKHRALVVPTNPLTPLVVTKFDGIMLMQCAYKFPSWKK